MKEKILECSVSVPAPAEDSIMLGGESTCMDVISYIPIQEDEAASLKEKMLTSD